MEINNLLSPDKSGLERPGLAELISAFQDMITDYPLCAIESDVADMDSVNHNVSVLKFAVEELLKNGKIDFEKSAVSPICK